MSDDLIARIRGEQAWQKQRFIDAGGTVWVRLDDAAAACARAIEATMDKNLLSAHGWDKAEAALAALRRTAP